MNANADGFGQACILPKSPADLKHMCLNVDGMRIAVNNPNPSKIQPLIP